MKADPAVQQRLLELADTDAELARIAHRRKNLPEAEELNAAEQQLREHKDSLVSVQATASDLDREVKRQEREIDAVRSREERDRSMMQSGSVSAKQLTDLEHELETLQRRQSSLEEDLLELMERAEAVAQDQKRTEAAVTEAEQRVADAQQRHDAAVAELEQSEVLRSTERDQLASEFPEDLLATYDRVRLARGRGAGLLSSRRCGACQLELDAAALGAIRNAAPDAVVTCDNCGAILVRADAGR